jgi:hypothetical protein
MFRRSCHIAAPGEQTRDRNILINGFPVQANAAQLNLRALGGRRTKQPRKPCERDAERAAVGQFDPHRIVVKADASRRNGHPVDCSPDGAQRNPGPGG